MKFVLSDENPIVALNSAADVASLRLFLDRPHAK